MRQTRRTFFAAIGAAVLGKYAVKFWPQLIAHINVDVLASWEENAIIVSRVVGSSRNDGLFGLAYYQVNSNLQNFMGIPRGSYPGKFRRNFDPARLPA